MSSRAVHQRPHDLGGRTDVGAVHKSEAERPEWATLAVAIRGALSARGLMSMDEVRRATEDLDDYAALDYNERRVAAMENLLIEKGLVTRADIDRLVAAAEHHHAEHQ